MKYQCIEPLCASVSVQGSNYCEMHQKPRYKRTESSYNSNPYPRGWQTFSKKFLKENPICFDCGAVAALTGHNINHFTLQEQFGSDYLTVIVEKYHVGDYFRSLCVSCNAKQRESERFRG